MKTYLIKIEVSQYVKDDQGFYVVWGGAESAKGLTALSTSFNRLKNGLEGFMVRSIDGEKQ